MRILLTDGDEIFTEKGTATDAYGEIERYRGIDGIYVKISQEELLSMAKEEGGGLLLSPFPKQNDTFPEWKMTIFLSLIYKEMRRMIEAFPFPGGVNRGPEGGGERKGGQGSRIKKTCQRP